MRMQIFCIYKILLFMKKKTTININMIHKIRFSDAFNCKDFYIFYQPIIMIFPQFVIYVFIYDYLKLRKDPSITSQVIANYISVALAVALSV